MLGLKCALLLCAVSLSTAIELGFQDVEFHLFNRDSPLQSQLLFPNLNLILASNFNPTIPTVYTIHSHGGSVTDNFNANVIKAHLDAENVNIIAVDWSAGSNMYTQGLGNARQCGERIAEFINIIGNIIQYNPANIRLVGIGLGAHIAGIAARFVNGDIPHIIALDPSLVGWTYNPDKLTPNDAKVVEVIHTSAGNMGYDYPLGDIDFYPNGGANQIGCALQVICSHERAFFFYAESINQEITGGSQFIGTECENYEQAFNGQCEGASNAVFGGLGAKDGVAGVYHFATNAAPPFALG